MSLICTTCNLNVENCKCEKRKACPVESGVIKQLFDKEVNKMEKEIEGYVQRGSYKKAAEETDKLIGINQIYGKLNLEGIAL